MTGGYGVRNWHIFSGTNFANMIHTSFEANPGGDFCEISLRGN